VSNPQDPNNPKIRVPKPLPKRKTGRPSIWDEANIELTYRLSLLGLTDEQQAKTFDIDVSTLHRWDAEHKGFREARVSGREKADAEVAYALRARAMGYSHKAEKIMLAPGGRVLRAEYTQHYPPDTQAATLWLANRQGGMWKSRWDKPSDEEQGGVEIRIKGGLPED
jgi:hypothetical protein